MASRLTLLNNRVVGCRLCPRLVTHQAQISKTKRRAFKDQTYWGKPVPSFGRADAGIVIVGLAPGAHGANRTGRMFTGDAAGDFLFSALYRAGLASQSSSTERSDGMHAPHCYITAAVRCAPPDNRPSAQERRNCRNFLSEEVRLLRRARVFVCLGQIAFEAVQQVLALEQGRFSHGACFEHQGVQILCSYHVSRQNTQTGRLTEEMFDLILTRAKRIAQITGPHLPITRHMPADLTRTRHTDTLKS